MIRGACLWLLASSAVTAAEGRPERAAAILRDEVRVPAGFAATIFATPDEANYPVFVAATADGTLFVSSDGNGSLGLHSSTFLVPNSLYDPRKPAP